VDYSNQLRRMNEHNREFWGRENPLLSTRISDNALCEITMMMLSDEQARLPVYYQNSVSELARKAEQFQKIALTHRAKKAGRKKKTDSLQCLIEAIICRRPHVTASELKEMLTRDRYPNVITDIEGCCIYFQTKKGTEKSAKISGLKDRLFRAKRAQMSREPV